MAEIQQRNLLGHTIQVVLYTGQLFRVDHEDAPIYVRNVPEAPFKFFTTTEEEALAGYGNRGHILRRYAPAQPLVLVDMFHEPTRTAIRALMTNVEQGNLNFSFPVTNHGISRRSEADQTARNYSVAGAICRLFAEHGIHGYYIPRSAAFHSEVMLCGNSLRPAVLGFLGQRRVSTGSIKNAHKYHTQSRLAGLPPPATPSTTGTNQPQDFFIRKLGFANLPPMTTNSTNTTNTNTTNSNNGLAPPPAHKRRRLLPFLMPHNNTRKNRRSRRKTRKH